MLNILCAEKWQQQGWKKHLASKSPSPQPRLRIPKHFKHLHVPVSAGYTQVRVQCLSEINLLWNLLERLDLCSSEIGFHSLSQKWSFFAKACVDWKPSTLFSAIQHGKFCIIVIPSFSSPLQQQPAEDFFISDSYLFLKEMGVI